jgi:serine/threonine protein kinase/dienelactone hydrolase
MSNLLDTLQNVLAGHYQIERELGRGGMAIVYLAQDLRHDRRVALKTLRPELTHALGPERFLREIQIAARLQHSNILPLHDSGEAKGLLYYVMPYVEGESLRARLEREGQLPIQDALNIACQVADALAYAHGHDVVHRDIKPENILLSGRHALIADFGIARAITAAGGERLTETGLAIGTAAYMSPEQAAADPRIDARSDVYSLGCVLYEMLVGSPPFLGPTAQALIARKLTDPIPSLRTVRESVSEALEQVILRTLARTAADRFSTAGELAQALEHLRSEVDNPPASYSRQPTSKGWSGPIHKTQVLISVGAIAVLVGFGGYFWTRESKARWARSVALPDALQFIGEGQTTRAVRLLRQAQHHMPGDPIVRDLLTEWTIPVSVGSTPAGAQVHVRDFFDPPDSLEFLGSTPLDRTNLPLANLVWTISLPGFQTQELLGYTGAQSLHFSLPPTSQSPPGMVHVAAGRLTSLFRGFGILPLDVDEFWIDKHEVTNRQFKAFMDAGGYERLDQRAANSDASPGAVSQEITQPSFRDRTGRPGPATWEVGTYPEGEANHPVGGVSWYEAEAYCGSVGKQLPTLYHWYHAAELGRITELAQYGNFQADGPAQVGHPLRLGGNGTYDMAGNIKEWVWNEAGLGRRYVLGGGWNEPSYQFREYDAQLPHDRQPTYGVRCVKYGAPLAPSLRAPVVVRPRDYRREKLASDEIFAVYKSLYQYDRTPLEAKVDSADDRLEHWRVEWVSFNAAYANERVPALLYLPKSAQPPYQTVVYFSGGPFFQRQPISAAREAESGFNFLVRSGRAVLFPLYYGTYERHVDGTFELPSAWRDVVIHASKDIGRSLDYVESRPDFAAQKVAYLGLSMGAGVGPIMTAVEPRFAASILVGGGLYSWQRAPESESFNFLPRVKVPTLMINGRHDFFFPLKTSQAPMFERLGTRAEDKRHRVFESGHIPTERQEVMKEILDWLDRYLGPVRRR